LQTGPWSEKVGHPWTLDLIYIMLQCRDEDSYIDTKFNPYSNLKSLCKIMFVILEKPTISYIN